MLDDLCGMTSRVEPIEGDFYVRCLPHAYDLKLVPDTKHVEVHFLSLRRS